MKNRLFSIIGVILCFVMLLSAASCSKLLDLKNTEGETDEKITLDDKNTEKPTQKKTEKRTEKKTDKRTEKQTEKSDTLKVRCASYNIYHAGNNKDLKKIAANITNNGIEIVGLQEVDNNTSRSGKVNQVKKLGELTGYQYYHFFKAIDHDGGQYGTAILSKYPIIESNKINLYSGSGEQRVLGHCVIDVNGEEINFFVTHLSYDEEANNKGKGYREKQFTEVATELAKYDNFVLSGDFNTRNLDEYSVIEGSALVNSKEDPKITYPDGRSPLDNLVYSTSTWKFDEINVVTQSYSDHYMIYADGTFTKK